MPGDAVDLPPPGQVATGADDAAALRARLLDAEARLTQTQRDLSAAQQTITALHAVPPGDAGSDGRAPTGLGTGGGPPPDGLAADSRGAGGAAARAALPPAAPANDRAASSPAGGPAAADDAPFGDDAFADYVNPDDGDRESDGAGAWAQQRWGGQFSGGCSPVAGGNRRNIDAAGAYDDGFDFCTRFSPDDWLQSFDIPRSVLPPDGLPMPFTPCDPVHTATFTIGSRDEIEARHLYCTLAWTQSAFNDLLAAQHAIGNTKELLEELVEYLVGATRRIYALGVSRYDYLALRQSEPNLADAFAHADAVPRNALRGDGARRFISRVVRAETAASAKVGAAERGYAYPQRANRTVAPAAARARSPARRSGGGGGTYRGGGRGGGAGGGAAGCGRGRGGGRA